MQREIIFTDAAPRAVGPYSQAVKMDKTVYLSGQVGLDPDTQSMAGDDVVIQAQQMFRNLSAVAEAAGGSLEDMVKLTLFLTDISDFSRVNSVMEDFFSEPYPARAAVGVTALPKGALVEVEAIMVLA